MNKVLTIRSKIGYDVICSMMPAAVQQMKYGLLHTYNLTQLLQSKGQTEFKQSVSVFEVCNPAQAVGVLNSNLMLSNLLPCRIVVYADLNDNQTVIQSFKPTVLLNLFVSDDALQSIAEQVESDIVQIMNNAIILSTD